MKIKTIGEGIAGIFLIAGTILTGPFIRRWYRSWGATEDELKQVVAGDELVPRPKSQLTMVISVQAPAVDIWPWFVQLGCQRGGWYSYDLLDNGGISSAEDIIPEFQKLEVGDIIKNLPKGDSGFPVALIKPGVQLTMAGTTDTKSGQEADPNDPDLKTYYSGNQTFLITEDDAGHSRLMFRMRTSWNSTFFNDLINKGIVEPLSFVMGRKTLLNVKRLAEGMKV